MIRDSAIYFDSTVIMSLDHDLYPQQDDSEDPGDGLDVAKFLGTLTPICPVIVHSSNSDRAECMVGELELAGWTFRRVPPWGSNWIESHWKEVVTELLLMRDK